MQKLNLLGVFLLLNFYWSIKTYLSQSCSQVSIKVKMVADEAYGLVFASYV